MSVIWLLVVPLISAIIAFFMNSKRLAVALSLIPLVLLLLGFNVPFKTNWIPPLGVSFDLSIDNLSLLFLYLSSIIIPISLLKAPSRGFYALALVLQAFLNGFFMARDLIVFTVFWEAMLLPLFLIIAYWGEEDRQAAALKFILYMIGGSALMIAGVIALYFTEFKGAWIFGVFMLAFAVKTPLFPFHAWLPDAYTKAPIAGTILLSAILSKAGIYGFLRIGLGIFPDLMKEWGPVLLALAITGVLYGALAAWQQNDVKRLIAYSSFSHVNFIVAGIFVFNEFGQSGAVLQAINHGITIAALFLVAGWLEERTVTRQLREMGGLAQHFPILCWTTLFFVLASVALPGTNNFIGELLILVGLFNVNPWLAGVLGLSVIFSAIYMLRWMQLGYFGPPIPKRSRDIGIKELAALLPLALLILWIGLYPAPVLEKTKTEITP